MDLIAALHTAARHYSIERSRRWQVEYSNLNAMGLAHVDESDGSWTYTAAAYDIFPRYNVLNAITDEVEHFLPSDFASLENARELLAVAGQTATSPFTKAVTEIEANAIADERRLFTAFVESVSTQELHSVTPLSFRLILTKQATLDVKRKFDARWGKWYGGCVDHSGSNPSHVTLHTNAMETPAAYKCLRESIARTGVTRLLELREWGESAELDLEIASFLYNGAEGFWTTPDVAWMVYASHESSITFGGEWLIAAMRAVLPTFDKFVYKGWDLAAYD